MVFLIPPCRSRGSRGSARGVAAPGLDVAPICQLVILGLLRPLRVLLRVAHPLDDVIGDEHGRQQLPAGHVTEEEHRESLPDPLEVHGDPKYVLQHVCVGVVAQHVLQLPRERAPREGSVAPVPPTPPLCTY